MSRIPTSRTVVNVLVNLSVLVATSCGSSAPSAPSAVNEAVSGVWIGNATLTAVSGGECAGETLAAAVGSRDMFAASIRQNAGDIAATVAYQGNRTSCALGGTVAGSAVGLTLNSCYAGRVERLTCRSGAVRDLTMLTDRVIATANNGTGTGTDVSTWNVFESGGSVPVGVLTLTAEFRWNITRLPHDDFHIFDGSILPGYVDGVVTIPAEIDPFCVRCGWF